ncbi:MAG: ATP-binding cassette domain-containing protein, partial [Bacteroidetes bacterium]|nr:ATP-binding cassette domain-containing protein [Bacteroidota bacterium]
IAELIGKLHLSPGQLNAYPNELSGGQQQRVGLARALIADPPILLMDEPFGALDNITRSNIQAEFKDLDELKKKTIVMVTHDVQEAFTLGDRICLMDKGKIIQIGTPAELLFKPANDFVRKFLDGQRLQLEFMAIKAPPPPEGGTFELYGKIIPADVSLWYLLEQLKFTNDERISVLDHQHKKVGSLAFNDLMSAFYQHQSHRAHE